MRKVVVALTLLSVGCAPRQAVPAADTVDASGSEQPVITLARTPCFGRCPVYRLAVFPSGRVDYQGTENVRHLGPATAQISPAQVKALLTELEQAGYFSFAPRYTAAEPACGRYATDSPSAITSVTAGEKTKRIEHDYGCGGAPQALVVLERRIDEVVGSGRWTGR